MDATINVIAYAQRIAEYTALATSQQQKISYAEKDLTEHRRKLNAICEERKKVVNALYEELKQQDVPAPFEYSDEAPTPPPPLNDAIDRL